MEYYHFEALSPRLLLSGRGDKKFMEENEDIFGKVLTSKEIWEIKKSRKSIPQ